MSKAIKQMQMDALKQTFGEVKDFVVLNIPELGLESEEIVLSRSTRQAG